jgi:intein-encoded DNA endonuclease-like protein
MGVVGLDIISKRGKRRRCSPLEVRMRIYDDVLRLYEEGLSHTQIQKRIYEKYGKRLFQPTISHWINGKHNPLGKVNKFDEKSSPELAYVIGVILSDGYKYFDSKGYLLRLAVNDREYAEEFGKCLAKVLGKRNIYKPFWNENLKQWVVKGCSILLYKFLDKPLEELKPYIEYSKETVASFLRALFDGDGFIHKNKRTLKLFNINEKLLVYVQYLLKEYFDINSTLCLEKRRGSIEHFPNGKIAKTTENYYSIYIHVNSLLNFYRHIGFTIKRKQQRLIKAIK